VAVSYVGISANGYDYASPVPNGLQISSASSALLINDADPTNGYWNAGSLFTLSSATQNTTNSSVIFYDTVNASGGTLSASATSVITFATNITGWPTSGTIWFTDGSEQATYTNIVLNGTTGTYELTGLTRGVNGTSPSTHNDSTGIQCLTVQLVSATGFPSSGTAIANGGYQFPYISKSGNTLTLSSGNFWSGYYSINLNPGTTWYTGTDLTNFYDSALTSVGLTAAFPTGLTAPYTNKFFYSIHNDAVNGFMEVGFNGASSATLANYVQSADPNTTSLTVSGITSTANDLIVAYAVTTDLTFSGTYVVITWQGSATSRVSTTTGYNGLAGVATYPGGTTSVSATLNTTVGQNGNCNLYVFVVNASSPPSSAKNTQVIGPSITSWVNSTMR
jgi:hypothetical protein